jgi:hypothetical protein
MNMAYIAVRQTENASCIYDVGSEILEGTQHLLIPSGH